MLLGFVLGPLMEENLRRAMLIARGDATVFFTRPISASLLAVAALLLVLAALPMLRKRREEVFVESRDLLQPHDRDDLDLVERERAE